MNKPTALALLSPDHELRNTPLMNIHAECRNVFSETWKSVDKYKIGPKTYNKLSGPWIECKDWRVDEGRLMAEALYGQEG